MPCRFILYIRFIYTPADMIVEEKWFLRRCKLVNAHFCLPRICPGCLQSYWSSCNQAEAYLSLPRSLCQALGSSFKPTSESRTGFLCWSKKQLPLKLLILPHLPLHVVPSAVDILPGADHLWLCGGRDVPVLGDDGLARLAAILAGQHQEKPALSRDVVAVWSFPDCLAQSSRPAGEPVKRADPADPCKSVLWIGYWFTLFEYLNANTNL